MSHTSARCGHPIRAFGTQAPSREKMEAGERELFWYCTATNDSGKYIALLGPFSSREDAESNNPRAYRLACDRDPRAPWYRYGVSSSENQFPTIFGV